MLLFLFLYLFNLSVCFGSIKIESFTSPAFITATYFAQWLGGLVLVICLVLIFAWIIKKLPAGAGQSSQLIKILAMRAIGTRERLILLQIGEEQILIGVSPAGIQRLHTLRHPISPPTSFSMQSTEFAGLLQRMMAKKDTPAC